MIKKEKTEFVDPLIPFLIMIKKEKTEFLDPLIPFLLMIKKEETESWDLEKENTFKDYFDEINQTNVRNSKTILYWLTWNWLNIVFKAKLELACDTVLKY